VVVNTADATAVFQLAEALDLGDGVTSIVRRAASMFDALGESGRILARPVWVPDAFRDETRPCEELLRTRVAALVFHYWGYNASTWALHAARGRKAVWYHNITPPGFFGQESALHAQTARGYAQLGTIANGFDLVIGDSRYNLDEFAPFLRRPRPGLHIYPVVDPEAERAAPYDEALAARLCAQPGTRIVFVGRLVRNKRQDDLLRAFDAYRGRFDAQARLWLIGADQCDPVYRGEIDALRRALPSGDAVTVTGKIPDETLRAHLRTADVLVCASEHEGFCLPIAQAMALDVPVVARAAAAVPETLGGGGIAVSRWDPSEVAELIHQVRSQGARRSAVLERQRVAVARFSAAAAQERLSAVVHFLRSGAPSPLFEVVAPPEDRWGARVGDER
jgi:glycosyltransferase involved in cell wall biosynthesis